jgi:hypothetical protein
VRLKGRARLRRKRLAQGAAGLLVRFVCARIASLGEPHPLLGHFEEDKTFLWIGNAGSDQKALMSFASIHITGSHCFSPDKKNS